MTQVVIQPAVEKVVVQQDGSIEVVSVGIQGPPGPKGDPSESAMWGSLVGAIEAQIDLMNALKAKLDKSGGTLDGNLNFEKATGTRFSAETGDSSITKNTVYQALDEFSRAWEVWLDKNGRNQAGIGWHGTNFDDGVVHNAWEVKTSVSPANENPGLMQTRIGIQSDKDQADFVMNFLDRLRLYKGDGSNTQTWNVIADTGSIEQLGEFKSKDAQGTSYITVNKKPTAGSMVQAAEAAGSATLDFEATPLDGVSSGIVRLFRNTATTNTGTAFAIYNATNANILQHYLSAKSNSYVNAFGGNFGIGSTSPTAKLDINGDTMRLRSSKTPANSTAQGNTGDIAWDSNYVYVCVAANTWKRSPLGAW
ncbi:hypothetical protein [Glutamicibacter halophytocola]|uniref:hypothetical protein n=1 Tax=Glutamicibacter halophytocola TaxID=1933880 RepID=UPI0015C53767|nr:hypothetical protein [Glutamicibacter halophytocola]NQD39972.1 hypothetical protein [Glutamicibacter halophytocola]